MKNKIETTNNKSKLALLAIWAHILFLTWVILRSNVCVEIKLACLIITMIVTYLQLALIQEYHILKIKDIKREHKTNG